MSVKLIDNIFYFIFFKSHSNLLENRASPQRYCSKENQPPSEASSWFIAAAAWISYNMIISYKVSELYTESCIDNRLSSTRSQDAIIMSFLQHETMLFGMPCFSDVGAVILLSVINNKRHRCRYPLAGGDAQKLLGSRLAGMLSFHPLFPCRFSLQIPAHLQIFFITANKRDPCFAVALWLSRATGCTSVLIWGVPCRVLGPPPPACWAQLQDPSDSEEQPSVVETLMPAPMGRGGKEEQQKLS